jgi:hypothetical protein
MVALAGTRRVGGLWARMRYATGIGQAGYAPDYIRGYVCSTPGGVGGLWGTYVVEAGGV